MTTNQNTEETTQSNASNVPARLNLTAPSASSAPPKAKRVQEDDDDGDEREPTDLEVSIAKFEARFSGLKHIDAKDGILQYMFPLLRALAKQQGDVEDVVDGHEQEIEDLHTSFDAGALVGGDQQIDALDLAFRTMAELGAILDETMVTAGFYTVNKDTGGLEPTKKVPSRLHVKYTTISTEIGKTVAIMQVAMRARQAEAEREEVLDRLEDEIEAAKAEAESATTDEAKAEVQAKVAMLEAQLAELQDAGDEGDEVDEGDEGGAGDAKDGE